MMHFALKIVLQPATKLPVKKQLGTLPLDEGKAIFWVTD